MVKLRKGVYPKLKPVFVEEMSKPFVKPRKNKKLLKGIINLKMEKIL